MDERGDHNLDEIKTDDEIIQRPRSYYNDDVMCEFSSGHLSRADSRNEIIEDVKAENLMEPKKLTKKASLDDNKRMNGVNLHLNRCKSKKQNRFGTVFQEESDSKYKNTEEFIDKSKKKESNATDKKMRVNNESKVDSNNNSKIKENRREHLPPVPKFLDAVRAIFPEGVSGVENIDECEGEAAIRQQNDLDELLLELKRLGFKRPMTTNNNVSSSNSKKPYQLDVPAQHKITNEEKVQNFLDNMERSVPKSDYESTPELYNSETLSSKDSLHTANNSTSHASIASLLANASLVSAAEEFLYKDDEEGVSRVEVHLPSVLGLALQDQQLLEQLNKASGEGTREKTPSLSSDTSMGSTALRNGLKEFGEEPLGPISESTLRNGLREFGEEPLGPITESTLRNGLREFGEKTLGPITESALRNGLREFGEERLGTITESTLTLRDGLREFGEEPLGPITESTLRNGLKEFGEEPLGPITESTRRVYQLRLRKLRLGLVVSRGDIEAKSSGFSGPMSQSLKNISCVTAKWADLWELEKQMASPFSNIDSRTAEKVNFLGRDAAVKTSFNYLLLDPRMTQNLPSRVFSLGEQELWRIFISALFYIGKGTRSRPFQHLYEASKVKGRKVKFGETIGTIHDIWEAGMGVISLQVFQNTIGVESLTREAAMIEAVGCSNLSNAKPGDWYGPAARWSRDKKSLLGTFLLFKAFKIFLQEGERQIRPVDLKLRNK